MSILIEKNIMVPMRDGFKLATAGGSVPVMLSRLPYNKERKCQNSEHDRESSRKVGKPLPK
jgi:predicted acyl esterase